MVIMERTDGPRPKLHYPVMVCLVMMVIMAAQLATRAIVSEGAFELQDLKQQSMDLQMEQQSLQEQLGVLAAPQNIAAQAQDMDMVIDQSPAFLRLSDGKIMGQPGQGGPPTEQPMEDNMVQNSLLDQDGDD